MGIDLWPAVHLQDGTVSCYCGHMPDSLVEKLAGVPAGTGERYRALLAERQESPDTFCEAVMADPELDRFSDFCLFGWGDVRSWSALRSLLPDDFGATFDRNLMAQLLNAREIHLPPDVFEELEGIAWG